MVLFFIRSSIIVTALCLLGCGAAVIPTARVASAEAAIRSAREGGAPNTPAAALYLHYAELERTDAQRLAAAGDGDPAERQYRRAEADANLALALSREAEAQRLARSSTDALRAAQTAPH